MSEKDKINFIIESMEKGLSFCQTATNFPDKRNRDISRDSLGLMLDYLEKLNDINTSNKTGFLGMIRFELLFMRLNKKGVIEALCYDVDIRLNSKLDVKYINKFISKHLEFFKEGYIRKIKCGNK